MFGKIFTLVFFIILACECYIVIRVARKNKVLNKLKFGNYLMREHFEIRSPAILYGTPIEIALKDGFVYFIKDNKYFSAHIEDFASIKNKNSKFIFTAYTTHIASAKTFSVKCDNTIFTNKLTSILMSINNNEDSESKNKEAENNKNSNTFMTNSTIKKASFIMVALGMIVSVLIIVISLSLYGKIYFYNGYAFTGFLWTMCFLLLGGGFITLALTLPSSRDRFVIIGVCYIVFLVIFLLLGKLNVFLITLIFMGGGVVYILIHHHDSEKKNVQLTKSETLKKRAKNKMLYSNVMAIILAVSILLSFAVAFSQKSDHSDPDGIDGWTTCYKCSGSGKVRNDLGYYVRCPRCNGVGMLPDPD